MHAIKSDIFGDYEEPCIYNTSMHICSAVLYACGDLQSFNGRFCCTLANGAKYGLTNTLDTLQPTRLHSNSTKSVAPFKIVT